MSQLPKKWYVGYDQEYDLKVSASGRLTNGIAAGEHVVAQAISVQSGVLKFRLLV